MQEINYVTIQNDIFESTRNQILCMDIIKKLRPTIEQYAAEVRRFIHASAIRGFDRPPMISHSIAVFLIDINSLIAIVEDYLEASHSPESRLIESLIQAHKTSIDVFIKTIEKIILEKPTIDKQLFFNSGRTKI